jgi:hypothetical protein
MTQAVRNNPWVVLVAVVLLLASAVALNAQVQTTTATEEGASSSSSKIETGVLVYVGASDVIAKTPDGQLHHLTNIPPDRTVNVGGKMLTIKDLKPGMTVTRVTTTKTVTGKVWNVTPPNYVILTLENGQNQRFKIPKGQMFNVNGTMTDAFGLKKGMQVSATAVTESPETVVATNVTRTGTAAPAPAAAPPPPPPPPAADQPVIVIVEEVPVPAAAPAKLPKTASSLPLIGLMGLLLMGASLGLRAYRRSA